MPPMCQTLAHKGFPAWRRDVAGTQYFDSGVTANTNVVQTTETVVATVSGVTTGRKEDIRVSAWCQFTTGANATGLIPRIRRGTGITGQVVGEGNTLQVAAAAGSTEELDITFIDPAQDVSSQSYVLTVQQVAATADGTALQASIEARIGK